MFYNINIKIDSYHLRTVSDLGVHRNVQNRRSDLLTKNDQGDSLSHAPEKQGNDSSNLKLTVDTMQGETDN